MIKQLAIGLAKVLLAVVIGSIVGGVLFAGIDGMRTFQSDTIASSVARTALQSGEDYTAGSYNDVPLFVVIANFIDWYSTVFFGYSRFGAGLFMLAATCWAVSAAKSYALVARVVIGFVAGFLMGTRCAMFMMSRPGLVLGVALIGGVLGAMYLVLAGLPKSFAPLPKLQFKHQP